MSSGFNATRLTCFALISALETDFRDQILKLESESVDALVWPVNAVELATARLVRERGRSEGATRAAIVHYLDFADSYQIVLANRSLLSSSFGRAIDEVKRFLELMIAVRNRVAHSRPMEIDDLPTVLDISRSLVRLAPNEWVSTQDTLRRLERSPEFVLGLTIQLPADPDTRALNNLPVPDFDETGFMGRASEIRRIKKAILGPYPVVSILGDGGIGKTAIALKVAYELLDDASAKFDSVVWVTAKATTLTTGEIVSINDAIQDSLGLFEEAARHLGGDVSGDPRSELLDYMENFKILLVLDNMETVNDRGLRDFLLELPVGSKVLITSRIGLGIENPVKLEPLQQVEAKQLLRALASIRAVKLLKDLDEAAIDRLVAKLQGHPLYIKWLVAGVQSGKRPTDLVNDNSLLLDFCMSNVYGQLGEKAKGVLQSMQVLPGVRSQGELAFINQLKAVPIQGALLELMTTNFVSLRRSGDDALEAGYDTGEFAAQYLSRHHPVRKAFRAEVTARSQQLASIGSKLRSGAGPVKVDERVIDVRGQYDVPSAKLLVDAQRELRSARIEAALDLCREAQTLSPTYYEAWRVEALAHVQRQDMNGALHAYERAYELASDSALMGYYFGTFLVESMLDNERGLAVLQAAAKVGGASPQLLLAIARVQFARDDFAAAAAICEKLVSDASPTSTLRSGVKLGLRSALFGAESLRWHGDLVESIRLLEAAANLIKAASVLVVELDTADWLMRLQALAQELGDELSSDKYLSQRCTELAGLFMDRVRVIDPAALSRLTGQVRKVDLEKHFAFAESHGKDYFFHHNDLMHREDWESVSENILVCFTPEVARQGPRARRVRVL